MAMTMRDFAQQTPKTEAKGAIKKQDRAIRVRVQAKREWGGVSNPSKNKGVVEMEERKRANRRERERGF